MKNFSIYLLIFAFTSLLGQDQARVAYEPGSLKIIKAGKTYSVQDAAGKKQIKGLKFIQRVAHYYQVLDAQNKVYYLNEKMERSDSVRDFYGVCGTVPHYQMWVKETDSFFMVYRDENFFDYEQKEGPELLHKISKKDADKVQFINGDTSWQYTSNFGYLNPLIDPATLVITHQKQLYFLNQPKVLYDSVCFNDQYLPSLKTYKKGFYGYYNICAPQFKWIGKFTYHLAPVKLRNGKKAYIDDKGHVYL